MRDGILEAHDRPRTLRAGLYRAPMDPDYQDLILGAMEVPDDFEALTIRSASDLPVGAVDPIFGEDFSANNGDDSLRSLIGGKQFGFLRVTGGLGFTQGVWLDQNLGMWERQIPDLDDVAWGLYGFPVNPNAVDLDKQLDVLIHSPRTWKNRIPMVDYELYGPKDSATCTPKGLVAYVKGIWRLLGGPCHLIIYSGYNFWNSSPFTGFIRQMFGENHRFVHLMNAWYFSMAEIPNARQFYANNLRRSEWWHTFGGRRPELTQFGIGVGNQDQDASRREKSVLRGWAER